MDSKKEGGSDFEILDVENYRGEKDPKFSHQLLVMECLRRVNEAGSHEMRAGWVNQKVSSGGDITLNYVEDTRKKFIESVKTAMMNMMCDYDTDAKDKVEGALEELDEEKVILLGGQWKWFQSLAPMNKKEYSTKIIKGFFNKELGWFHKYVELELDTYREIAMELHNLTKRLDFYEIADFEA